jgi:dTDP-4-dehydrorhamnose reductase
LPIYKRSLNDMRIVVTGSQGQIAQSLLERAPPRGVEVLTLARPQFDLTEPASFIPAIASIAPHIVINAAAYTSVDKAEDEEATALRINSDGADAIAFAASRIGAPIIQLSTDYVFDGGSSRPYREDDATDPLGAYGRSKLLGEQAVKAANSKHVILRTSWVYSPFGANFVRTMLRLGETRKNISVVADQIGQPTSALDIADAILDICQRLNVQREDSNLYGVFHLAGADAASWADFAEAIFAMSANNGRHPAAVNRITTAGYPTPARRPANSRLDTLKLATVYRISLPSWRRSLPPVIERLLERN